MIYSLKQDNLGALDKNYEIDQEQYSAIYDIFLDSGLDKEEYISKFGCNHRLNEDMKNNLLNIIDLEYCCSIACKHQGITGVHIFDINNEKDVRSISYQSNNGDLFVKISEDLFTVMLSTGFEHYMLKGMGQQNLPGIKDKILRSVISKGEQFYMVN